MAISQTMELLIIAGAIGLIADVIWVIRDILSLSHCWLYLIGIMLATATLLTIYAGYKHHMSCVENYITTMLKAKVKNQQARRRKTKTNKQAL